MRILFLTFYFEPDLCAGSFRATALVPALAEQIGQDGCVEVLTTQPNRYRSFECNAPARESRPGVEIVRFALPMHRSGFLDQSFSFLTYAWRVLKFVRGRRYDIVLATSSRLMTAFLGALVSRWKRLPLYLDIRDIFVDTMQDVLPPPAARAMLPVFRGVERFTMRRAARINLVSEGFRTYFDRRYPGKRYGFVPNGIDEEFLDFNFTPSRPRKADRLVVLYAGNVGEGQGLHRILPGLASATRSTHEFWVVGDGGARAKLERAVDRLDNVKLMQPVGRQALLSLYRDSDILFLHLNDYPAFRTVLPSKLFEYAATGKPILAGVAGHAAEVLGRLPGVALFPPCDVQSGRSALAACTGAPVSRADFVAAFRRDRLMRVLSADIVDAARSAGSGK
jgi:glycosyltransferase involved in cell wall biosynthesis